MEKKFFNLFFAVGVLVFSVALLSACNLRVSLINQDPYPVTPGESVDMVFQVTGVSDSDCGTIRFDIQNSFPFTVDPGMSSVRTIQGGLFSKDYENFWLVPYTLRVDEDAKEGDNPLDILVSKSKGEGKILHSFDVNVKDVRTDFEISVKNYNPVTKKITFEILNSGKNNIEALSIELETQESIVLMGASTNIIGSLDSNDFTTAEFEASAEAGNIALTLYYTDITDTRRSVDETVSFDPAPFILKSKASQGSSTGKYVAFVIIVGGIAYYFYRKNKKKKEKHRLLHEGRK